MAQTGYTPILIYSSSTAAAAPTAGNLTNSTLGSELAINITDGKLFYKDNANAIQVIGWKVVPTTAGGTGLTSYSQGDLLYYNSGTTLTALAKSTTATRYLSNTGTNNNPAWAQVDLTNGVTGTLPVANGGTGTATAFTAGSVIFAGASGVYNQKNASFFWDNTNNRLGLGTAAPANTLHILDGIARITSQNANATSAYYYQTSSAFTAGSSSKYTYYTDTGTYSGGLGWFTNSGGQAGQFLNTVGTALGFDIQMGGTGVVRFQNSGGVSVGNTTDPGAGSLNINSVLNVGTTTNSAVVTAFKNASGRQTIYYAENASTAADAGARFRFKCGTQITDLYLNGSGNDKRFYIENNGSGVYLADGGTSWTNTSDERFKDIIEPITDAASKVSSLRAVIGKFKTDAKDKRRSFLIAQDILAVLPEAVDANNPEQLGVSYTDVIPLLVAAIKELTDRVSQLENKGA